MPLRKQQFATFAAFLLYIKFSSRIFEHFKMEEQGGVFLSTAGAVFQDRESIHEHYQSEFHR
jgi:hypothetical protein